MRSFSTCRLRSSLGVVQNSHIQLRTHDVETVLSQPVMGSSADTLLDTIPRL